MVSTTREVFTAEEIEVGSRTRYWSGQMSDESVQQLSRDRTQRLREDDDDGEESADVGAESAPFDRQYGSGTRLGPPQ
jgi:hypothetical protein